MFLKKRDEEVNSGIITAKFQTMEFLFLSVSLVLKNKYKGECYYLCSPCL